MEKWHRTWISQTSSICGLVETEWTSFHLKKIKLHLQSGTESKSLVLKIILLKYLSHLFLIHFDNEINTTLFLKIEKNTNWVELLAPLVEDNLLYYFSLFKHEGFGAL